MHAFKSNKQKRLGGGPQGPPPGLIGLKQNQMWRLPKKEDDLKINLTSEIKNEDNLKNETNVTN